MKFLQKLFGDEENDEEFQISCCFIFKIRSTPVSLNSLIAYLGSVNFVTKF